MVAVESILYVVIVGAWHLRDLQRLAVRSQYLWFGNYHGIPRCDVGQPHVCVSGASWDILLPSRRGEKRVHAAWRCQWSNASGTMARTQHGFCELMTGDALF